MYIEHRVAVTGSLWPTYSQYGSYVHKRLNKTLAKIHRIQAWPFIVLSDDRHVQADGNNALVNVVICHLRKLFNTGENLCLHLMI